MAQGANASFKCQNSAAELVAWRVNDTFVTQNLEGVSFDQETEVHSRGIVYTLMIKGLPEYNQTTVVCVAVMANQPHQHSGLAVLQIQGNLFFFRVYPVSRGVSSGRLRGPEHST